MNDNNRRIDVFLKFFRDIMIENPGYNLTDKTVYHELTRLGVPANERGDKVNELFPKLINYFEYNSKCDVFVSENWSYFCQFIARDGLAKRSSDHLKIYIPLDKSHIEQGCKEIFDFLSRENISHVSKMGSNIRFDDIVVRLINPDDVLKLVNFINSNKYISDGLLPSNPFAYSFNGVAMAVDGRLSFNSTLSVLISIYINNKKLSNNLSSVGVDDFYNFVQNYYNYVFNSLDGIEKLKGDFKLSGDNLDEKIINYKNVFELILKVHDINFDFKDYLEHYRGCLDSSNMRKNIRGLKALKRSKISLDNRMEHSHKNLEEETKQMLKLLIEGMMEKYNDINVVLSTINNYLNLGSETCITRYKGLRNIIVNSSFRDDLNKILQMKRISFFEYCEQLSISKSVDDRTDYSIIEKNIIMKVHQILNVMTARYGSVTARNNLINYIKTGDANLLTRDSNLRFNVVNSSFRDDIVKIIDGYKVSVEDYLNNISTVYVNQNEIYLEEAIITTYLKYEDRFSGGLSLSNGSSLVSNSLLILLKTGDYAGFTRDGGARQNLQENVSVDDIKKILNKRMGNFNIEGLSDADFYSLVDGYVNDVLKNNAVGKKL